MERLPVDIIVPIYNAYEDLRRCVKSIKKYTDLTFDRLVLINDCSTEEYMLPYLETLKDFNILVINNSENKGFSGNVNFGMALSEDRDVILLNSDTIVTRNWVNKIVDCAYSAEEIGTVTPLSNSATLCSVPVMCQDNQIPEGFTIDEYASLIERCSLRRYPKITVAVGFCMFIKRKTIKEVGWFDAKTFERGYGEENDFCNRAEQLGYIHVMCDDTFIYHRGTVSFVSEEKQKLIEAHDKILQERYPKQMRNNHLYCMNNPDQYIRDNINFYAALCNGKGNLLYLVHSDFREDADNNVGGTQLHVKDLVREFKKQYNIFVMARVQDRLRLSVYLEDSVRTMEFVIGEMEGFSKFTDKRQLEIYRNVLSACGIQLVHIHHTYGLTFDLFYAAKELGIPVYLTLHDFYYVCPNEKLLPVNSGYCNGKTDAEKCRQCLHEKLGVAVTVPFLDKWRKECLNILKICQKLIVPSNSTKEIYSQYYPEIAEKIEVIYHGSEFISVPGLDLSKETITEDGRIHCNWDFVFDCEKDLNAVIGWCIMEEIACSNIEVFVELTDQKNEHVYAKAKKERRMDVSGALESRLYEFSGFRAKPIFGQLTAGDIRIRVIVRYQGKYYTDGKTITYSFVKKEVKKEFKKKSFHVAFVGGMVEAKGSALAYDMIRSAPEHINWFVMGDIGDPKLAGLEQDNLVKTGVYEKNDLPILLDTYHIDLVCILSIWPETFCYTISEALLCKTPVLVTDIGALGERLRQNQCGWIVDADSSADDILQKIMQIAKDKKEYNRVKSSIDSSKVRTVLDMIESYKAVYAEQIDREPVFGEFNAGLMFEALRAGYIF